MPVKRKIINLTVGGNSLTAADAQTGLETTDAGVQGEDGAVWFHAAVPSDWQDLSVRLQVLALDGSYDESGAAVGNVIDMPLRQALTVPGRLTVRLIGSETDGVRRTADCVTLTVTPSAVAADPAPHLYPYPVHRITGSGGALVTQTDSSTWNVDVTGTGGDMLQANYASGAGASNVNKVDHAIAADTAAASSEAVSGSALEAAVNGWIALTTCVYASAAAFTIAQDMSAVLAVGDRIRLVQSGATKYFYVVGVSVSGGITTVTVTGGSDYSLANAAITSPCVSNAASPAGFPDWLNWSPTFTASGNMTFTSVATNVAKFKLVGKQLYLVLLATGTTGGTADVAIDFSLPVTAAVLTAAFFGYAIDGSLQCGFGNLGNSTTGAMFKYNYSNWSLGTGRGIRASGFYPI